MSKHFRPLCTGNRILAIKYKTRHAGNSALLRLLGFGDRLLDPIIAGEIGRRIRFIQSGFPCGGGDNIGVALVMADPPYASAFDWFTAMREAEE